VIVVSAPTSVKELFIPNLNIIPNPFADYVRITGAEGATLQITTVTGALVLVKNIENSDEIINLENLPSGVYFFRFERDGNIRTERIIKN